MPNREKSVRCMGSLMVMGQGLLCVGRKSGELQMYLQENMQICAEASPKGASYPLYVTPMQQSGEQRWVFFGREGL